MNTRLRVFGKSVNEAVVASMRTQSGQRDLEKKGGKLIMKMPNGEVLKFKDGADVKEYMDRVYGYWSFIKGYGKVKGLRESTAAYEKALQKIAKDKQLSMLSKKDRETLLKVARLMKSANEDVKINEADSKLAIASLKGDYPGSKAYQAVGDGSSVKAQTTNKVWKDGAPMTNKFGPKKTSKVPKGKFWVLDTNKFWYYELKGVWNAIKKSEYGTPPGFEY